MPFLRLSLALVGFLSIAPAFAQDSDFTKLARGAGVPRLPGLKIVYLSALGDPALAPWRNIILHQTEGPAGSAAALARQQAANPEKRGVMLWVETDGTIYWATAETTITTHGDGANRNDNKYIDNTKTYHEVVRTNSIGIEFTGNYPDPAKPLTSEQFTAGLSLVRLLQERYGIPADRVYAHNWIDYKDTRYCEGCALAERARAQAYVPTTASSTAMPSTVPAAAIPAHR